MNSIEQLFSEIRTKGTLNDKDQVELYIEKLKSILDDFYKINYDLNEILKGLGVPASDGYIGRACELTVAHYFLMNFPEKFMYQVESNLASSGSESDPRKNFDFSFSSNGIRYNVEVKTFALKPPSDNAMPIKFFLTQDQIKSLYAQGARPTRNCLPRLGRFLRDANEQLVRPIDGLSGVLLCCTDLDEYADVVECLITHPNGILHRKESDSIAPSIRDLANLDFVVICNIAFGHNAFFKNEMVNRLYRKEGLTLDGGSVWEYKSSVPVFPIAFPIRESIMTEQLLQNLHKTFYSHYSFFWSLYKTSNVVDAIFGSFNEILSGRR